MQGLARAEQGELNGVMRVLAPDSAIASWAVSGTGSTNGGELDEVTLTIESAAGGGRSTLRTMRRLGATMGPFGSVHGQVTDTTAIAQLAIMSVLLEAFPAGLEKQRTKDRMREADANVHTLAADRLMWDVIPLPLDGIDYALWTRSIPGGVVAHADLGWATVAMWGTTALYSGDYCITEITSGTPGAP